MVYFVKKNGFTTAEVLTDRIDIRHEQPKPKEGVEALGIYPRAKTGRRPWERIGAVVIEFATTGGYALYRAYLTYDGAPFYFMDAYLGVSGSDCGEVMRGVDVVAWGRNERDFSVSVRLLFWKPEQYGDKTTLCARLPVRLCRQGVSFTPDRADAIVIGQSHALKMDALTEGAGKLDVRLGGERYLNLGYWHRKLLL